MTVMPRDHTRRFSTFYHISRPSPHIFLEIPEVGQERTILLLLLQRGLRQETHPCLYKRKHITSKRFVVVGDASAFPFGAAKMHVHETSE